MEKRKVCTIQEHMLMQLFYQQEMFLLMAEQQYINGPNDDTYFSNFTPEIYKTNDDVWKKMSKTNFRRNYHSTSLLLPDGRVFVAGGDVWNAQFFYPPYLFD
jgi:hypothetical protein